MAQTAPVSVKLKKTTNLAAQLTSAEWFMSFPGTARRRSEAWTAARAATLYERHPEIDLRYGRLIKVLQRMGTYAPGTTPLSRRSARRAAPRTFPERLRPRAEFLASINLSESQSWTIRSRPCRG